jgi:HEAT repeat protein
MMSLPEIQANLANPDPKARMRGITALKDYEADLAVPLLVQLHADREMMIRSFVAMGLGYKRNDIAFGTLTAMLKVETDNNVRAEVVSALIKYGHQAIPLVVPAFYHHPDWLMRMSILLALTEMDSPQELFQLCLAGFVDPNETVCETAVQCLGYLANSAVAEDALLHLLAFALSDRWEIRKQSALSLFHFTDARAAEALIQLRQDADYRVVAAVMEGVWHQ